jgi:O-antigen/teichoic acid export membrane protein
MLKRPSLSGWSRPADGFRRASLTVLAGSGLGHFIGLALTPVIARLYSPGDFGVFASVIAASTTLVGISTFRLEVLAQGAPDDSQARSLFRVALTSDLAWGLVASLGAIAVTVVTGQLLWLTAGVLVVIASLQLVGSGILTRTRAYGQLAGANFTQGSGSGALQVVLGVLSPTPGSLLAGFVLARLVWVRAILGFVPGPRTPLDREEVRRFAFAAGPSALVNSLGGQAPILLASLLFGSSAAGLLAMAIRLIVSPLSIVAQAAASATLGEVGRCIREGEGSPTCVVRRAMRDLFLLGFVPCSLAALLGRALVPYLLGTQWATTGTLVALLATGTLAQLVVSPFAQLLNLLGRSRLLLAWDITRLVLIAAAWLIPAAFGQGLVVAVGVYSSVLIAIYGLLWCLLRSALSRV